MGAFNLEARISIIGWLAGQAGRQDIEIDLLTVRSRQYRKMVAFK